MEAIFKITAAEFDLNMFKKIEDWVKKNEQSEIVISIKNESFVDQSTYENLLKTSINEISDGKSKTFSMEELEKYITSNFK